MAGWQHAHPSRSAIHAAASERTPRPLGALVAAWFWYARVDRPPARPAPGRGIVWEPVTPDGARRTQTALESLAQPQTNSVVVSAGDVASYIFFSMANRLPEASRS